MKVELEVPELDCVSKDLARINSYSQIREECHLALSHALQLGDPLRAGWANLALGESERRVGNLVASKTALESACVNMATSNCKSGLAWTYWALANHNRQISQYAETYHNLCTAFKLARESRDERCCAYSLAGIAEDTRIRGNYGISLMQHTEAMNCFKRIQDVRGVVWALEGIAQILKNTGQYNRAIRFFAEALRLAEQAQDLRGQGYALKGLGEARFLAGDRLGLRQIVAATELFRLIDFRVGTLFAEKTMADMLIIDSEIEFAIQLYTQVISEFSRISNSRGVAYAEVGLANAFIRLGKQYQSIKFLHNANMYFCRERVLYGIFQVQRSINMLSDPRLFEIRL